MLVFTARAYVCSSLELQENQTIPQGRSQDLVPLYHLDRELRPSPLPQLLTLDGSAASGLYWIGKWCFVGCVNRFLYVLVSLSQKDWVRKARFHFLPRLCLKFD